MAIEIEAKMKLDRPDEALARLAELRAEPIGEFLERNDFYDTPARSLLAGDQGLRLRVARELATGQSTAILTHKGPNGAGQLKRREETELTVSDADDAARLLGRLGYVRFLSFEKRRRSWRMDGCRVELDEVPHLGFFLEIEGPDEPTILALRQKLGLDHLPLIRGSYASMLAGYCEERGLPMMNVRFES